MDRQTGRRSAAGVLLLLVAPVIAGCGTPRVAPSSSSAASSTSSSTSPSTASATAAASLPAVPPSPSANDFVTAIIDTQSAGSARLSVDLHASVAGIERDQHGAGVAILDPGWADLTWTSGGATSREMVNDQGIFVQASPPDGRWIHIRTTPDARRSTPTSGAADPLRDLETLQDVVDQGPEVIGGVDAERYGGTLPVDPAELSAMGLSDEEITAIDALPSDARIEVTLWFDGAGHVIRVDRLLNLGSSSTADASAFTTVTLSDFGTLLDLTSPPSKSVDQAPEGQ